LLAEAAILAKHFVVGNLYFAFGLVSQAAVAPSHRQRPVGFPPALLLLPRAKSTREHSKVRVGQQQKKKGEIGFFWKPGERQPLRGRASDPFCNGPVLNP